MPAKKKHFKTLGPNGTFDLGQEGEACCQTPLCPHAMCVRAIFVQASSVQVAVSSIPFFCHIQANVQRFGGIAVPRLWSAVVGLHTSVNLLQPAIHLIKSKVGKLNRFNGPVCLFKSCIDTTHLGVL